jgi:hypothetical protein
MDQSDEVVRLLEAIRDNQREQLEESKKLSQEYLEMHRKATEKVEVQYRRNIEATRSLTWSVVFLIAACVAGNLFILARVGSK